MHRLICVSLRDVCGTVLVRKSLDLGIWIVRSLSPNPVGLQRLSRNCEKSEAESGNFVATFIDNINQA